MVTRRSAAISDYNSRPGRSHMADTETTSEAAESIEAKPLELKVRKLDKLETTRPRGTAGG